MRPISPERQLIIEAVAILHRDGIKSPTDFSKEQLAALAGLKHFGKGTWDGQRQQALLAGQDTSEIEARKQRLLDEVSGSHTTVRQFGTKSVVKGKVAQVEVMPGVFRLSTGYVPFRR